jgi:AbrB family looped-hinge helix DNA binding protein
MSTQETALRYLATTRIGEKGQVTIPKEFRQSLDLPVGAPFAVLQLGAGLILLPEQRRFDSLCEQISSSLTGAGLNAKAVLGTLPKARALIFARRYRKKHNSASSLARRPRVASTK